MSTAVLVERFSIRASSVGDAALEAAARLWYLTAVVGQLVFAFEVAFFYTSAAVRGNFGAWNRTMSHGYVPGDPIGNVTVAVHLLAAVFIVLSGAVQLIPDVRRRAPALHRWNGRLYMAAAFTVSTAGLYMLWVRGGPGSLAMKAGMSLNAVLILAFAGMALRSALARDFKTHRRWALRLFLAVGGVWFLRVAFALSFLVFKGPVGFDPKTFEGPFLTFLSFAQYLVPLAVLELYLRAQDRWSGPGRLATATGLLALTVAMGIGIFAATMVFWLPGIKAASDSRKSIDQTLSATIASEGIEAAVRQYRRLRAEEPAAYNFSERELNRLGYRLVGTGDIAAAIRIFQLNVEAYPRSGNVYDSLGEAYRRAGNRPLAIESYRRSLELDPDNRGAAQALQEMRAE